MLRYLRLLPAAERATLRHSWRLEQLENSEQKKPRFDLPAATRPVKCQTQVLDNRLWRSGGNSLEKTDGVGLLVTD